MLGFSYGFVQQYRFIGAENAKQKSTGKVISLLLLAGIVSAFIGPEIGTSFKNTFSDYDFLGSYIIFAVVSFCCTLIKVQSLNDGAVFGIQAVCSGISGVLLNLLG